MTAFVKDPQAKLDYGFDWSDWLIGGEVLQASTWTVPIGLTKGTDSLGPTQTLVWISGGIEWIDYNITNHVTTTSGREDDRTLVIKVRQR